METEVVVIGGGATGLGVAWDLTLRGVSVVLAEMGGVGTGTSGRFHGLLHSGARYAVSDQESARECIEENTILRAQAARTLEDTGGLFVLAPGDDPGFVDRWTEGCRNAGIPYTEIDPAEALLREPFLHPGILRAFEVPDATCDSFVLCEALQRGAEARGAQVLTYHRVEGFHRQGDRISGVHLHNLLTDQPVEVTCRLVVIAAGPWSARVAGLAGVFYKMNLSRGAMLGLNGRWVNMVINRLRKPSDGDILLPWGKMAVLGTTSIPTGDPGDDRIEPKEIQHLFAQAQAYLPGIHQTSILRAWAGVRPLYDPELDEQTEKSSHSDARAATRTFTILDHEELDGVGGLVSIIGGKLTTFRRMAEKTTDLVCLKLDNQAPCRSSETEIG